MKCLFERLAGTFCCQAMVDEDREVTPTAHVKEISEHSIEHDPEFHFEVLKLATHNFKESNILGIGGFGAVYRGRLKDGRLVAVKRLKLEKSTAASQFINEAKVLRSLKHKNIVNLVGYCVHGSNEKLLVYEYMPKKSLNTVLFTAEGCAELSWPRRHAVVIGVARGLLYLHQDAPVQIIHRDIKLDNILLDDRWTPKIGDFGLARLFPDSDGSIVKTRPAGTYGYMAPEYKVPGSIPRELSTKADVYSFGIVVLEIISGKRYYGFIAPPDAEADISLCEYAWDLYQKGRSIDLVDPAAKSSVVPDQVELLVRTALFCVQPYPYQRPDMKTVVHMLSAQQKSTLLEKEPPRPQFPYSMFGVGRRRHVDLSTTSSTSSSRTGHKSSSIASSIPRRRSGGLRPGHHRSAVSHDHEQATHASATSIPSSYMALYGSVWADLLPSTGIPPPRHAMSSNVGV